MSKYIIMLASLINCLSVFGQKRTIDSNAVHNWATVHAPVFSYNGDHCFFIKTKGEDQTLVLRDLNEGLEVQFMHASSPLFSSRGKYFVFEENNDTICFYSIPDRQVIKKFRGNGLVSNNLSGAEFLIWNVPKENSIRVWSAGSETFSDVRNIDLVELLPSMKLLYSCRNGQNYEIFLDDLKNKSQRRIWSGSDRPIKITYSPKNHIIAAMLQKANNSQSYEIIIVDDLSIKEISRIAKLNSLNKKIGNSHLSFSKKEDRLIFRVDTMIDTPLVKIKGNVVKLDVWHFDDKKLQEEQLSELNTGANVSWEYWFYSVGEKRVRAFGNPTDEIIGDWPYLLNSGRYILAKRNSKLMVGDFRLDPKVAWSNNLLLKDLQTGAKYSICPGQLVTNYSISPGEKYVIYYNQYDKHTYSFEIATHITRELSLNFFGQSYDTISTRGNPLSSPFNIVAWTKGDESILVSDRNDIWQIKVKGNLAKQSITHGYGRKYNVNIQVSTVDGVFDANASYLVTYTGDDFKERVFFAPLEKCLLDSLFQLWPRHFSVIERKPFGFLVQSSDGVDAANWYLSKDLKKFIPITSIHPQYGWKWFTKELVNYPRLAGGYGKGILYKPEDFDSTKRYPVIINVYERFSQRIYESNVPALSDGQIDPSWMCSRGYIIFQPDIDYKYGNPGSNAYDAIVSSAEYLRKKEWVDSMAIGLSGVSHGAFAINYTLTKTKIFAAAAPAFGIVDLVGGYGSLRENGLSRQYLYETAQGRIGNTLWFRPDLYIKNSAIFGADKVTTPVLIVHNKLDVSVPWSQGVEWFTALQRNGKKVWMLQYDGEGHGLFDEENQSDYTMRLEQFFDHYLKGKSAPLWMTKGIPAKSKGIESGLALDDAGATP